MKSLIFTLLFVCSFSAMYAQKKVAFLHDPSVATQQVGVLTALQGAGYTVTVVDAVKPFDFTALGTYDLIVISRGVSSGAFSEFDLWNAVSKPVLCLSPFVARDSRMKLIQGIVAGPADMVATPKTQVTNAVPVKNTDGSLDPVFTGVTTGDAFPMYVWTYVFLDYQASDWALDGNSGKVLALLAPDAQQDGSPGAVIMARWAANTETYAGAGTHVGARSYIDTGADDSPVPPAPQNVTYDNYTTQGLKLIMNEVKYLLGEPITGVNAQSESQFNVYPNPSIDGKFDIQLKGNKLTNANLKVYTITGMQVYNKNYENTGRISLNLGLNKGVYILEVSSAGMKSAQKIVIK